MRKLVLFSSIFILVVAGITYFWLHSITKKIFIPQTKSAQAEVTSIQGYLDTKTPFNILLAGYGGGNHDGTYLTDSLIVVHIDPKIQKVFLVSIPRDIWVKIPTNTSGGEYSKINAAYSIGIDDQSYPNKPDQFKGEAGGAKLAKYVASIVTGQPIQYFVGMDFAGFTNTIDTLGGVDITVEKTFDDYAYPIEGKEDDLCGYPNDAIASFSAQIATGSAQESDIFTCRFEHIHFTKGEEHMDGTTALKYVRSRHSLQDGTDFGRANRQRNLLVAVKDKVISAGFIPRVIPFMTSLGNDLRVDLTPDDVKTLIQNANVLNKYQVVNLALTDQNYLKNAVASDGEDILEPIDGIDKWTTIHNFLADEFSGKTRPAQAVVLVENGSGVTGLAGLAVNRLKDQNIQVLDPTNAQVTNQERTKIAIYDKNINLSDIAAIRKEFPNAEVSYTTVAQTEYNILVIVGYDYNKKVGKKLLNEP